MKRLLLCIGIGLIFVSCAGTDNPSKAQITYLIEQEVGTTGSAVNWRLFHTENDGTAFYLGHAFRLIDRDDEAYIAYRDAWQNGPDPWKDEAGLALAQLLTEREDWRALLLLARKGVNRYRNDVDWRYHLMHSYYRLESDVRLLRELEQYRTLLTSEDDYQPWTTRKRQAETALWEAVANYRLELARWPDLFRQVFAEYSADTPHVRLFLYLRSNPQLAAQFSKQEMSLFEAKYQSARRNWHAAARLYVQALETGNIDPDYFSIRTNRDVGRAFSYAGFYTKGIEQLDNIAATTKNAPRAMALEWSARLFNSSGGRNEAAQRFYSAFEADPNDRLLWLYLNTQLNVDISKFILELEKNSRYIEDSTYFSDLLDRTASMVLASTDWSALSQLYELVDQFGSAGDRAHWAVLLHEAVTAGRLDIGDRAGELRSALHAARLQQESPYWALLAAAKLGMAADISTIREPTFPDPETLDEDCAQIVDGFLFFDMTDTAGNRIRQCRQQFTAQQLIDYAQKLSNSGNYYQALRALETARYRNQFPDAPEISMLIFPQAFLSAVEPVQTMNRLPKYLFYSLLREESYFAPEIISHAGAVGLAQMMPATASDVARQMNIALPDLTKPEANVTLGGFYLRKLLDYFDDQPVYALAAYNAGQTRVRRWKRQLPTQSLLLFAEAIPLVETRNYIRKIVLTNAYYSMLYEDRAPEATVQDYFPDIGASR